MSAEGAGEAHLDVTLSNEQSLEVDEARLASMARRTADAEGALGEISITLVDSDRMLELNRAYMGEARLTDVLAFPIDDEPHDLGDDVPPRMIGEVVVCPEVAFEQAEEGLEAELDLLVAHGVLHLLGYDHDTEAAAAGMRAREERLTGRSGARA